MGSSLGSSSVAASPAFLAAFRERMDGAGCMSFATFMELALYHPKIGYYKQKRERVGFGRDTDFFTASTSAPVFGELVVAACTKLLEGRPPGEFTFVEVGAEPGRSVLRGVAHPFGEARTISIGEPLALAGKCVVFSNELFDAQPFRRFIWREEAWREIGVALAEDRLSETELSGAIPGDLPPASLEGYRLDVPRAATDLANQLAAPGWSGLFVACDYGKSWRELIEAAPQGTARAYHRHTQSNDLLARPGEQDLTCHVCWDWLAEALRRNGFRTPVVESQEAFFIHHAGELIARTTSAEAARFSPKKLSLLQLLHPANLGQKFQVLHGWRD